MRIRKAITTAMTRIPIATHTQFQRLSTLASSVRLGSVTFIVVAMSVLPPLAGGRVAGAKPIVDALGEMVGSLRLAEDVPGVALDGRHDAQRRVDALVDRPDVGVDPLGHVEDRGGLGVAVL